MLKFDLDYTLIKTKSGRKFPKDGDDWVLNGAKNFITHAISGDVSVVIEDDVVEPDIEEDTDSESSEPLSERAERRRRRAEKEKQASLLRDLPPPPVPGELALDSDSMPLPPPPGDPSISGLPPPPDPSSMGVLNREVSCSACGAVFNVKGAHLMRISCPVCDESLEV